MEYFRSLLTLLVPELFEPANVMMVGVVGVSATTRMRVFTGAALILGGVVLCSIICLFAGVLGVIFNPGVLALTGAGVIVLMGTTLLFSTRGNEPQSFPAIEARVHSKQSSEHLRRMWLWLKRRNLIVQAFLIGFAVEMVQSSALLVLSMASASDDRWLTFLGAASAHIAGKGMLLSVSFGIGYLLWHIFRRITGVLCRINKRLAGNFWLFCMSRGIRVQKAIRYPSQKGLKVAMIGKVSLALAFIGFGCISLVRHL